MIDLTGWKLDEARAALHHDDATRACVLRVVETAPPPRPSPPAKSPHAKSQHAKSQHAKSQHAKSQHAKSQHAKSQHAPSTWGAWRVLRCRRVDNEIELMVAREQIAPPD